MPSRVESIARGIFDSEPPVDVPSTALGIAAVWSIALAFTCLLSGPFWGTHDDVYGAMATAGYGLANAPSWRLFYSSALFAQGLQLLRPLLGSLVFPVVLYGVLAASSTLIVAVVLARVPRTLGLLAATALFAPAFLFPQFTEIAAIATLAGLFWVFLVDAGRPALRLAAGLVCIALGLIIRFDAGLLMVILSGPFLLSRRVIERWAAGMACLVVAIGISSYDRFIAPVSPQWRQYREVDVRRLPFSDYRYAESLELHPECLDRSKLSANDAQLLEHWFYADRVMTSPETLDPVLACVSTVQRMRDNVGPARQAVTDFVRSFPGMLLIGVILLAALHGVWRAAISGVLASSAFLLFSLLGRPFPFHVSYPLGLAVGVFALTRRRPSRVWNPVSWLLVLALFALTARDLTTRFMDALAVRKAVLADLATIDHFEGIPYVWSGAAIKLDVLYRPFDRTNPERGSWVFLGALYRSPMVQALDRQATCTGFLDCLLSGTEVEIFTSTQHLDLLRTYLKEHHGRTLHVEEPYHLTRLRFFHLRSE